MIDPATLGDAIAQQPIWLRAWVMVLVLTHLSSLAFMMTRATGRLRTRYEAMGILASFVLAGVAMEILYQQVGYVRLLGLPHLVFWTPIYIWILRKALHLQFTGAFKWYIYWYLAIAGTSLVIDFIDLIRYFLGV